MSNQQPSGYFWSSPAGNSPAFGAPSSAPVGGLANTPSGAAYNPTEAGATATAVSFADAPIAPVSAPTGGSTTNPYIVPPKTAYAPTSAGAPATAASFANAPVAPVPAPTRGFSTTSPYTAPPGAAYALAGHLNLVSSPGALATTARFANVPYPFGNPQIALPGYTYHHQPPQFSFIPVGGSIPIPVQGMSHPQQPSIHAAPPLLARAILPAPTIYTQAMGPPAQILALPLARFPTPSSY